MSFVKKVVTDGKLGTLLVASKPIDVGKKIISEKPLIVINNPQVPNELGSLKNFPNKLKQLFDLQSTNTLPYLHWKIRFFTNYMKIMKIVNKHLSYLSGFEIEKYVKISMNNGFRHSHIPGAIALYDTTSRINHSCIPNAFVEQKDDGRVNVIALKHIDENEPLSCSYIPLFHLMLPTHLRQERIADVKFFQCMCPRCTSQVDELRTYVCNCDEQGIIVPLKREPGVLSEWAMKRTKSFPFRFISDVFNQTEDISKFRTKEEFVCKTCGRSTCPHESISSRHQFAKPSSENTNESSVLLPSPHSSLLVAERQAEQNILLLWRISQKDRDVARPQIANLRVFIEKMRDEGFIHSNHWLFPASSLLRLTVAKKCELNLAAKKKAEEIGTFSDKEAAADLVMETIREDVITIVNFARSHMDMPVLHVSRMLLSLIHDQAVASSAVQAVHELIPETDQISPEEAMSQEVKRIMDEEGLDMKTAGERVMKEFVGSVPGGKFVDPNKKKANFKKVEIEI